MLVIKFKLTINAFAEELRRLTFSRMEPAQSIAKPACTAAVKRRERGQCEKRKS